MAELNVVGVGVVTADPELKYVGANNTALCTVSLAFNRNFKAKNGDWQKEACFMRAQLWGPRAERMSELVRKGQPIYVNGYLKQDEWTNKEGQKRVAHSITIQDFQLCQKNDNAKSNQTKQQSSQPDRRTEEQQARTEPQIEAPAATMDDDEIPF